MRKKFFNEKGITMISLVLTIIVMMVILTVLTFYIRNSVSTEQFHDMKADIIEIESKALDYYLTNDRTAPVYMEDQKTQDQLSGDSQFFNPNDGPIYARVNLEALGVVPAYNTTYYMNTETLTVYALDPVKINSKSYPRMASSFTKVDAKMVVPEWEKECLETAEISKMFKYDAQGMITGIDFVYCAANKNTEYFTDEHNWKKLVVPVSQPDGKPVTGIAISAFHEIAISDTIKIPYTVKYIDANFLRDGVGVKKIYCDASGISVDAFKAATNVEELHMGPSSAIPSADTVVAGDPQNGFMYGKQNLKKVWIDTTAIGDYAFANCTNLNLIVLNNNIRSLPNYCFSGIVNGTTTIYTSNMVHLATGSEWPTETPAKKINLPEKLEKIGNYTFFGSKSIKGALDITECTNLKTIGTKAFLDTEVSSAKLISTVNFENGTFPTGIVITYK